MLATLQRKSTRQPQQALRIDRANALTAGLTMLQVLGQFKQLDLVRNINSTVVGTKQVPTPAAIVTGFGSALGAGTTDRVPTPLSGALVNRSYAFTARRNGAGGGSLGRLFDKTSGSAGQFLYWSGTNSLITYGFYLGGVEQSVQIPGTLTTAAIGTDFQIALSHSVSGTSHTINAYVNGIQVVTNQVLTGTLTDAASTVLTIGNRASDGVRNWDGLIGLAATWDRIISPSDAAALYANQWQILSAGATPYPVPEVTAVTGVTGTFNSTLAGVAMASAGLAVNAGAFASTLGGVAMSASGSVGSAPSGAFASTLAGCTMAASGAIIVPGVFASSLAGVTMNAAGAVNNRGALASTLDGVTMSAAGIVAQNATGTFASTLDGVTMAAYGYNGIPPDLPDNFQRLPKNPRHVLRN